VKDVEKKEKHNEKIFQDPRKKTVKGGDKIRGGAAKSGTVLRILARKGNGTRKKPG